MSAVANIVFSFAGTPVFLPIASEMRRPADFHKYVALSSPLSPPSAMLHYRATTKGGKAKKEETDSSPYAGLSSFASPSAPPSTSLSAS
jgi:hypothetical protein